MGGKPVTWENSDETIRQAHGYLSYKGIDSANATPEQLQRAVQVGKERAAKEEAAKAQRANIARRNGFNPDTGRWEVERDADGNVVRDRFQELQDKLKAERDANQERWENSPRNPKNKKTGPQSVPESYYYHRLANLFEETRDSLEDVSAKRRERQVKVAGLEGQVNPHGFVDLVKGIRNVQAFSGMGGGGMPKERVEKKEKKIGEKTVGRADQREALMRIMSASQNDPDFKDKFTKEDALNPDSLLHKALVSKNPSLQDESKVMAKYYTGS
jgi:hypothetical protein